MPSHAGRREIWRTNRPKQVEGNELTVVGTRSGRRGTTALRVLRRLHEG